MPPARRVFHEGPGFDSDSDEDDAEPVTKMVESVSRVMRSVIQKRGKRRSKKQHFKIEPEHLIEKLPISDGLMGIDSVVDSSANTYDHDDYDPPAPLSPSSAAFEDDEDEEDILPSFGPSLTLDDDDAEDADEASDNVVQVETEKVYVVKNIAGARILT